DERWCFVVAPPDCDHFAVAVLYDTLPPAELQTLLDEHDVTRCDFVITARVDIRVHVGRDVAAVDLVAERDEQFRVQLSSHIGHKAAPGGIEAARRQLLGYLGLS